MKQVKYLFLIPIVILYACLSEEKTTEKNNELEVNYLDSIAPLNVIVLLDLSNRIDTNKHPRQAEKDQVVIGNLLDVFGERQKQFGYMVSKDKFSIVFANQSDPAFESFEFMDKLSIDMEDHMTNPKYKKKKQEIVTNCSLLYHQAVKKADSGADIYTWLKDQYPSYHRKGKYKNKIIVLTDGYLAFDPEVSANRPKGTQINWSHFKTLRAHPKNWIEYYQRNEMGFTPIEGADFKNTSIRLMEVEPRETNKNPHEFDLLRHFWEDWFNKMNLQGKVMKSFSDQNQLKYGLKKFIPND